MTCIGCSQNIQNNASNKMIWKINDNGYQLLGVCCDDVSCISNVQSQSAPILIMNSEIQVAI